jgi:hypothetical protein
MSDRPVTENELARILINPFYTITVHGEFTQPHAPLVSRKRWVGANANLIREHGAEAYLHQLLAVLEGEFVTANQVN